MLILSVVFVCSFFVSISNTFKTTNQKFTIVHWVGHTYNSCVNYLNEQQRTTHKYSQTQTERKETKKKEKKRSSERERCIQKKHAIFWHFVNTGIEVHGKEIRKDNERKQEKNVGENLLNEQKRTNHTDSVHKFAHKYCRWWFLSFFYQYLPKSQQILCST